MIVPVHIDTGSILAMFDRITQSDVDNLCDNVAKTLAARYAAALEVEANNTLHQTKRRYVQAISLVDSGRLEGTVILDFTKDPLIRMIEEGVSAFDMKRRMLASPKAKLDKHGNKYLTIPFRFGTPGIVGDSDVFSSIMPDGIYEVIKGKDTNIATVGGTKSAGLKFNDIPVQFQTPATRAEIRDSAGKTLFKEYVHKSPIYQGMFKQQDAVTGQNTYHSFRRVSDNSDPLAFIHPGLQKYGLVTKALNGFKQADEVTRALNFEFSRLGLM